MNGRQKVNTIIKQWEGSRIATVREVETLTRERKLEGEEMRTWMANASQHFYSLKGVHLSNNRKTKTFSKPNEMLMLS